MVQTPDVFGHLHDLRPDRREGARGRRAADRGRHRGGVARPRHAAGRHGRRHRGRRRAVDRQRAARSAGPMSGCSRRGRNSCARCRDDSPARPSTPKASAASCSRSRRASSTSAARRRPPTSAPTPASACSPSPSIMTLLGEAGLRRLARVNHANAVALADTLGDGAGRRACSTRPSSTSSRSACRATRRR